MPFGAQRSAPGRESKSHTRTATAHVINNTSSPTVGGAVVTAKGSDSYSYIVTGGTSTPFMATGGTSTLFMATGATTIMHVHTGTPLYRCNSTVELSYSTYVRSPLAFFHGIYGVTKKGVKNCRAFNGIELHRSAVFLFSKSHGAVRCGFYFLRSVRCGAVITFSKSYGAVPCGVSR